MSNTVAFWDGVGLPPIDCYVGYVTTSSGLQVSKVIGYDVCEAVAPCHGSHRVFVKLDGNSRLLHDLVSVHNLGG
jgi:hypothetical protein